MLEPLQPTPERIAAARRAANRLWTFGPEGTAEITTNSVLAEMVGAGLIKPHFVSAAAQLRGFDDHYRLTPGGEQWLDWAEQQGTDPSPNSEEPREGCDSGS